MPLFVPMSHSGRRLSVRIKTNIFFLSFVFKNSRRKAVLITKRCSFYVSDYICPTSKTMINIIMGFLIDLHVNPCLRTLRVQCESWIRNYFNQGHTRKLMRARYILCVSTWQSSSLLTDRWATLPGLERRNPRFVQRVR